MSTYSKTFEPDGCLYDRSTFGGRVFHFFNMINPLLLLPTNNDIIDAQKRIQDFRDKGKDCGHSNSNLWKSKLLVDSAVHPDNNEILCRIFRLSAFLPANAPIVMGMTLMPQTLVNAVMWQWINQTYNAAFNYGNANKTNDSDLSGVGKAYAAASIVSVGTAVGLRESVLRAPIKEATRNSLLRLVPFTAVAAAGVANAVLMRSSELFDGISVQDKEGNTLPGKSIIAARTGLTQIAISRVVLAAQVILLPTLAIPMFRRIPIYPKHFIAKTLIEGGVVTSCLAFAVPVAVASFPQTATLPQASLEPEFQKAPTSDGFIYFNKGL